MPKFISVILLLFICQYAFADATIQKVEIVPLTGGVSFNTVSTLHRDWITAPSVEMRGRKELMIMNTSTTGILYLTDISDNSAVHDVWRLYPRETMTFKAASNLHIYASGSSVTFNTAEIR